MSNERKVVDVLFLSCFFFQQNVEKLQQAENVSKHFNFFTFSILLSLCDIRHAITNACCIYVTFSGVSKV